METGITFEIQVNKNGVEIKYTSLLENEFEPVEDKYE